MTLPQAGNSKTAALTIQQPPPGNAGFGLPGLTPAYGGQRHQTDYQAVQILDGYDESEWTHYDDTFRNVT